MVRVLLAEDHHIVRRGLRALLETIDDVQVVGEAEDGQAAVQLVEDLAPDVLVMDIGMPRLNGIHVTTLVCSRHPATRVVILSMYSDETLVRQALRSGASGYVLKRSATEELLLAIRAASRGETYLSPAISQSIVGRSSRSRRPTAKRIDSTNSRPASIRCSSWSPMARRTARSLRSCNCR